MSANHHWMKFWPQDWQRDPALRSCGIAARGLWIDLICLAHGAAQYSKIEINGQAASMKQIASISGITERQAEKLLKELETAGVFSRDEYGIIYSRRMLRDFEAARAGRESVARRWHNPTDTPNTPPNRDPNREANRDGIRDPNGGPNSLEAEAESEADYPPTPFRKRKGGLVDSHRSKPVGKKLRVVASNGHDPDPPPVREPPTKENGFNGWKEDGREVVGGYYIAEVVPWTLQAAGLTFADDKPVRDWLKADIEPDQFLPVIRQIAARADYAPPRSLAYFDRSVRAAKATHA